MLKDQRLELDDDEQEDVLGAAKGLMLAFAAGLSLWLVLVLALASF